MKLWTKLFGRKSVTEVNKVNKVNDVIEVYGIRCEHVGENIYNLEGVRYEIDALSGRWKCLQCGEEGRTSRVPSVRAILENLSGHHHGRHKKGRVIMEEPSASLKSVNASVVDNGDGTVTDHASGLMWQKDDDGIKRTQQEAFLYCTSLAFKGFHDWRLPHLRDFENLTKAVTSSGIKMNTIYSSNGDVYWTATDSPPGFPKDVAYAADGTTFYRTNKYYVRAVRPSR